MVKSYCESEHKIWRAEIWTGLGQNAPGSVDVACTGILLQMYAVDNVPIRKTGQSIWVARYKNRCLDASM